MPADDPNDPLQVRAPLPSLAFTTANDRVYQWSKGRKSLILLVCSVYSFLSNSALLGPSVYIGIFAEEFAISPNKASNLVSYANLAFGFGASAGKNMRLIPWGEWR